jgi:hypothetical protein
MRTIEKYFSQLTNLSVTKPPQMRASVFTNVYVWDNLPAARYSQVLVLLELRDNRNATVGMDPQMLLYTIGGVYVRGHLMSPKG